MLFNGLVGPVVLGDLDPLSGNGNFAVFKGIACYLHDELVFSLHRFVVGCRGDTSMRGWRN